MIHFENHYFEYEMVGEFHAAGDWIHPQRIISSYELILVLDDVVYIREGETDFSVQKNDLLLLSPGVEHRGIKHSNTSFYWFHFNTDLPLPSAFHSGKDTTLIKQLIKQLLHFTNTPNYPLTAADSLGYLIYTEFIHLAQQNDYVSKPIISQITEYIRNHRSSNPTVSEIASHFGYSSDHIGKLFKKVTGIGLKEYIAKQRIKLIKDRLLTTNKTIKQIAHECEFPDENLFVKFFTYHEQITPSGFRSISRNTHINHK